MSYVHKDIISRYTKQQKRRISVSVKRSVSRSPYDAYRSRMYNKNDNNNDSGDEECQSTLTWSPLPHKRTINDLCLALFCEDSWTTDSDGDEIMMETAPETLKSTNLCSKSTNLRSNSTNVTKTMLTMNTRRRKRSPLNLSLDNENVANANVTCATNARSINNNNNAIFDNNNVPLLLEGSDLCQKPCTNPRDSPTHRSTFFSPTLCTNDLKLHSLHDLEWLRRMEPPDQTVLQVHVIWSILSLMVVLLACYSSLHHHHSL